MQNNTPLISIITAFYNEEILLSRCLESIKNQTSTDFELVLVNDGSTDKSLIIAQKYQADFINFKLISIENSGLGEARNIGLKYASGDYITFLDADDEFELTALNEFQKEILANNNPDLIICDYYSVDEMKENELKTKWNEKFDTISTSDELAHLFYNGGIVETVWSKIFKTTIAKDIFFNKGLWFEDRPFLIEFILKSKSIRFIPKKLVFNYRRKTSITRRILEIKRINDVYQLFMVEKAVLKRNNVFDLYKHGVFKNALDYFMDTFIIYIIDKHNIVDINEVQNYYNNTLLKFKSEICKEKIQFKFKDKIALFLLSLPKYVGWKLPVLIISIAKKSRLANIKLIKNTY